MKWKESLQCILTINTGSDLYSNKEQTVNRNEAIDKY